MIGQKSLAVQKVEAYAIMLKENQKFWDFLFVFLSTLVMLSAIQFYPLPIIFLLAAVAGIIAFYKPPVGIIASFLLAIPAFIYQSAPFAWIFLGLTSFVMFEVFEHWFLIAVLQILIFAPFSFGRLPFAGFLTVFGMAASAYNFGSKKSILIAVPTVLLVLLLSSFFLVQNSAFMPLNLSLYSPDSFLRFDKPMTNFDNIASEFSSSLSDFFNFDNLGKITGTAGTILVHLSTLLLSDSAAYQAIGWAIVLALMAYLSGTLKGRSQFLSSLALLLLLPFYYFAGIVSLSGLNLGFAALVVLSIAIFALSEQFGLKLSREAQLNRARHMKEYGKLGFKDVGAASSEKLADLGGYEDVKEELRDAIIMPLEKKDIAHAYGMKPPSGVLLFGPPGTGKTMIMRALAAELKYEFVEVKCSQILSQWYGESLPYDEKILIERDGRTELLEIGKVVENRIAGKVLSFNERGTTVFSKIRKYIKHKCSSKILEIKTRTGRRIRVTDYHSLFTFNGSAIKSVPTSQLIPGVSYIAIPNRVPLPSHAIDEIDVLAELGENDHGLFVRNAAGVVRKAEKKLGEKRLLEILGVSRHYLNGVLRENVGIRAKNLFRLMKAAAIDYGKENLVFSGKRKLPVILKIDEKLATFLGLWVADGCYNRKDTVRLSCSIDELEKVSSLCSSLFGPVTVYKKGKAGVDLYIGSRALYVIMNKVLGLEQGSHKKQLPSLAFNLSERNLRAILRGYFSGDGSVYPNANGVPTVEAGTVSKNLADQVLYLLLCFGIVARVYDKKEWNGSITKRICFTGHHYLNSFSRIGFMHENKNQLIAKYVGNVAWCRSEQIPLVGRLKETVALRMPKMSSCGTIGKDILMDISDDDEFEQLKNNIYLDRVEEITVVEDQQWVYDIAVDPCQNFVAGFGGIFAHNSEKNIAEAFDNARKHAPTILFFDEIDSIGKKRDASGTDEVTPRVLSTLLQEMDGAVKSKSHVIVIGTTNVPNQLDPALLRPGRFDKIIYMHLPDAPARKDIFMKITKNLPLADDVDFSMLAKKTDRFSGADIKNVVNESKRIAAKSAEKKGSVVPITMADFLAVLRLVKPSTGFEQLEVYEKFRMDFERSVIGVAKPEEEKKELTWSQVAGMEDVKKALLETIQLPLLHEEMMKKFSVKPSKGILLFGPPGTGKTLLVRAAANELNVSFQTLSGADLSKEGPFKATGIIKEAFNRAKENTPAILFVDEIETFAPARGMSSSEVVGQFLTEMDGTRELKGVVVIGATNMPELVDKALLRPGRFDKIFYIPPPDAATRKEIFKIHLVEFAKGVDLQQLADATEGFSGADIASICQEAKMAALREKLAGKENPKIKTGQVQDIIAVRKPSITPPMLRTYENFLEKYGERR
ncbi:MAG: AAA family ATPase [Candidatus Micrarchaeota archaeon]